MPIVSVIIPVYNSEKYLKRCLDSVLKQTFTDIEIIIINDGSTDNSENICNIYKKIDPRIIIVTQSNQGVSAARNHGISLSKGEYILFCDSDDEIASDYIECLVEQMNKSQADLCICPFVRVIENKYSVELLKAFCIDLSDVSTINQKNLFDLARLYLLYGPYNKIFKASIIKNNSLTFPIDTSFGEDLLFVFSYLECSNKISYQPYSFYLYYSNENSLLYKYRPNRFYNSLRINNCVKEYFIKTGLMSDDMQKEWANRIIQEAIGSIGDLFDQRCNLSEFKKIQMIKHIISNENTIQAVKNADWSLFNKYYMNMIKNKLFFMIYLRKKLAQIKRK